MDLELSVVDATIKADGYKYIKVCISGADMGSILDEIKIDDIVSHYGVNALLDAIGENPSKDYFGLYSEEDIGNFDSEFENI